MGEPSVADRFFVDATSPAFRDDPYPLYESYRSDDPLLHVADTIWFVLAHAEVNALLRDPRLSSDERRATTERGVDDTTSKARSLLFMDPPDHTRLRSLVVRAFTPRRVADLRRTTEAATAALLDAAGGAAGAGQHDIDLIAALAYPLPVRVICGLLGVPAADEHRFHGWSRALTRALDPSILRSDDDDRAIADAEVALADYLGAVLDERRRHPADDLLSALVADEHGGGATHQEIVDLAVLLLIAGHETTVNLIGNGVLALLDHPGELARLRSRPDLVASAVDELLRYDSPVQLTQRVAVEDLELAGRHVRAGDELVLVLGAANRDPAAFVDPHRLDVTRDARRHVSFGGGIHHCLGATLARMEGEVAIGALLHRFGAIERSGDVERRPTFTLRGLESLPVRLSR